ncbi:hypothetical protein TSUD_37060 [Trifolium subterraneum]|uniref:Uncharacterized protein n=1 Tax=Trifolium subterraneum TaxID=3900 RepID=A0A2Z6MFW7_TRISU|nr:hypothetical protein TSUD_37060 [Trifolium subterraneum]
MNNTSINSENPSEKSTTLPYYYIGFSFAFILLVIFIPIYFSYCNHTNSRNRQQSAAGSNNNRTVILMERDHTTEVNIEEQDDNILNSYPIIKIRSCCESYLIVVTFFIRNVLLHGLG